MLDSTIANQPQQEKSRADSNRIIVTWAYHLFLTFASEISSVTESERVDYMDLFQTRLLALDAAQRAALRSDPLCTIAHAFTEEKFNIVSKKTFMKHLQQNYDSQLCYVHKSKLIVSLTCLLSVINNDPNRSPVSDKLLGKRLREAQVIPQCKDAHTASHKVSGKRYVPVHIHRLLSYVQSVDLQ